MFPHAGKGEGAVTLQADSHRLLRTALDLPLVEPPVAITRQRLVLKAARNEGFSATVSALALMHMMPDLGVFGPGRNQTPAYVWSYPARSGSWPQLVKGQCCTGV